MENKNKIQNEENTSEQETKQFLSKLRSLGGRCIEKLTQLLSHVDTFFGLTAKKKAKIESEAEENFNRFSSEITTQEVT